MNINRWKLLVPLFLLGFLPIKSWAFFNMAYVGVNSHALSNAGCYIFSSTKNPFFDMVSVFAGNINGETPDKPFVYLNPHVKSTLESKEDIKSLQGQGIKVLLTILGNHQNAGWSCFTSPEAAERFADQLADVVNQYDLDGIDIDDEYSTCEVNNYSMIMVAKYLKSNPKFKGKLLTKALSSDDYIFISSYDKSRLSDLLDYGWEMNYGSGPERLQPYTKYGMSKNALALGISTHNSDKPIDQWVSEVMTNGYGGIMVFNLTADSQAYLNKLAKGEYGQSVDLLPNCLK